MEQKRIYVSLTSIFKNQKILLETLKSLKHQTKKADKIFLFLSDEPYLLDEGFKNKEITYTRLRRFIRRNRKNLEIKWVSNTGPFRKLLPLLKEKWEEDCLIITTDDDTVYHKDHINNLVSDYEKYECVVGYRGFTPKISKLTDFDYHVRDKTKSINQFNFLTGKGGILYHTRFFKKTIDIIFDDKIYLKYCDKQDDIWFYLMRIINDVECYIGDREWCIKDNTADGLYETYNKHENNNTKAFKRVIKKIRETPNFSCKHF